MSEPSLCQVPLFSCNEVVTRERSARRLTIMKLITINQLLTTTLLLTVQAETPKVAAMAKTLYIIDGHFHIYGAFFAPMGGQLTGPSGEPTKAIHIFTMALLGLIKRQKPDMLVVALDSKVKTFRSDIYPEYKSTGSSRF
jgi:hypothetical protein